MEKIEYIRSSSDFDGWTYKRLNRTGRCRRVVGPFHTDYQTQHRDGFFKQWVSNKDIVLGNLTSVTEYDCNGET